MPQVEYVVKRLKVSSARARHYPLRQLKGVKRDALLWGMFLLLPTRRGRDSTFANPPAPPLSFSEPTVLKTALSQSIAEWAYLGTMTGGRL